MSQSTRRNFIGTGLGGALAFLAAKGFAVKEVKAQGNKLVTIQGLTSVAGATPHVHGFSATLNLDTGEFTGMTTTTINVDGSEPTPHIHGIDGKVDPFDFDEAVETSAVPHIHLARPN